MPKAPLRFRLLALALAPLLVLGAVEGGLRLFGYRYDPAALDAGRTTHPELGQQNLYTPHPELLWTLWPSTVLVDPDLGFFGVHTNSLGLRGGEIPRGENALRVLCLGDSITFGLNLLDDEPYPVVLAEELRLLLPDWPGPIEIVNGAVPGWSAVQGLRFLDCLGDWEPDLVVFWFGMNDGKAARGRPDSRRSGPAATPSSLHRSLRGLRLYQLLQQILVPSTAPDPEARRVSVDEFATAARSIRERWGDRAVFVRCPHRMSKVIDEFRVLVTMAEAAQVRFVVGPFALVFAWAPADEGTDFHCRIGPHDGERALIFGSPEQGVRVGLDELKADLDLLIRLRNEVDARLDALPPDALGYEDLFGSEPPHLLFSDNCHMNSHGAALAARAIARVLAERLR